MMPFTRTVVFLLTFGALTWVANAFAYEKRVEQAVQNYQERGGRVVRAETQPGKPIILVDLHRVSVGDADLAPLAQMHDLEILDLSYTQISDEALKYVVDLPRLKQVSLYGTRISNKALKYLSQVKTIETLFLAETSVDDEGVASLTGLRNLQAIELDHTKVGDGALAALGRVSTLRRIELHHNPAITDAGLLKLSELNKLQNIDVWKTSVTAQGAKAFQKARPKTQITY